MRSGNFINYNVAIFIFSVKFCRALLPFDLYIDSDDVQKLLGVSSQVWYVRDGEILRHAFDYVITVSPNISRLTFYWQAKKTDTTIPYNLSVNLWNRRALDVPKLDISPHGHIPHHLSSWTLTLNCTGLLTTTSDVIIQLELPTNTSLNHITSLKIRRRKICFKKENRKNGISAEMLNVHYSTVLISVTVGFLGLFLIIIITLASFSQVKKSKGRGRVRETSGIASLSVPLPNNQRLAATQVHCSFSDFRRSPQQTNTTSVTTAITTVSPDHVYSDPREGDIPSKLSSLCASSDCVTLGALQIKGTFGRVHHGLYQHPSESHPCEVMIKTVAETASDVQRNVLVIEGLMLAGLSHDNLLSVLVAVTPVSEAPLLVFERPSQGNLKYYLQNCHTLLTQEVVSIGLQVLKAMVFLHSKFLLHKDIATRNCVVTDSLQVKLSDCALSRDFFPSDYHCLGDNENRPIKWLALESLCHRVFSPASDVWAWGVLLWEVMTLGQQPYAEIDPFEMANTLRQGIRLAQPFNCPDDLFKAMTFCWTTSVGERPTVDELILYLTNFLQCLERYV